jgi:hypothetical protein
MGREAPVSWEQLQSNWAVIMGFAAGLIAWGGTANAVKNYGEAQDKMDERMTRIEGEIASIRESAASMAASAHATKESVQMLLSRRLK